MRLFKTLVIVSLLANSVLAYDVNKDLRNLGPAAYDIAVVLSGSETVTGHYDGYPSGKFASFASGPFGVNSLLHWQNFWDGTDNKIDTNQIIHVGWTTADHSSSILDMYWTNQFGRRIPGSAVYNITSGWTYETARKLCLATWVHNFAGRQAILINNIRAAVSDTTYPLAELNGQNIKLMQSLRPIARGATNLAAGREMAIPIPNSAGRSVVVVYEVRSPDSSAASRDFVQFRCNRG